MNGRFVWTDPRVRNALGLAPEDAEPGRPFQAVSTDTRTVGPGDLFVALAGERFDGHDFLREAADRGAAGAVVSSAASIPPGTGLRLYPVADTLEALGSLARFRRRALPGRVVAITGSSGKTTVKELLAAALRASFRVHATRGNLNNRIGVPLSLLSAPDGAEMVVIEMGTSEPGEIRTLAAIGEPDAALVTTVGEAHLSGLGTFERVLDEKLDLLLGTREGGPTLVGDEPPELPRGARRLRPEVGVAGFSAQADPEWRAELLEHDAEGRFRLRFGAREMRAGIPGRHGAANLVLALAMARLLGAEEAAAVRDASAVEAKGLRGEMRSVGTLTLLLDCYNANPQSVEAALDLLAALPAPGGRVAVLASMLELGERSGALHAEILDRARALPLDAVVAIGEFAAAAERMDPEGASTEIIPARTAEEGYQALRPRLGGSETILLKGSRGMALEELLPRFEADFGSDPAGSRGGDG